MIESHQQRLASPHFEDLAFIALTARSSDDSFDPYPVIDDENRARLRSRIRQLNRYDWPSSMAQDPLLRRGYTLHQCCWLALALCMVDSHLPPSLIVLLLRNNERGFLAMIAGRLDDPGQDGDLSEDLLAVVMPGEIQDALALAAWTEMQPDRVRFVRRDGLSTLWSNDLAGYGSRLVIDAGASIGAIWRWLSGRRLMGDAERIAFLKDIKRGALEPHFFRETAKKLRR